MKTRITIILVVGVSLLLGTDRMCAAPFGVFAPTGWLQTDGPDSSLEPFTTLTGPSIRYQQVYRPNTFSGLGPGPFSIDSIIFRLDATYGMSFDTTLFDIEVNLSTTTRGPDDLSTIFADNVGVDDMVVYPRGELFLTSDYLPGESPQPLNITINFAEPFYYDTNNGNLLLDVRNYGGGTVPFLDAVSREGDDVSRVWANSVSAESGMPDTLGLATMFSVTPIPEPATWALLLSGAAFSALVLRRRGHHPK